MTGLKSILNVAAILLLALLIVVSAAWGVLAVHYSDLASTALRNGLAGSFGLFSLAVLAALASRRWRWRALGAFVVVFAVLLAWWSSHCAVQ